MLDAHPDTGLVYTDYVVIDKSGKVTGEGQRCRIPYSKEQLLLNFMTFHFRLIRRSVFDQVGGIDESLAYAEDYDLCLRLSEVTTGDNNYTASMLKTVAQRVELTAPPWAWQDIVDALPFHQPS